MDDTQPSPAVSEDDIATAEVPGELGDPTLAMPRVPTGATPTAQLPRTVPPPQRPGYVAPGGANPGAPANPKKEEKKRSDRDILETGLKVAFAGAVTLVLLFFLGLGSAFIGYIAIANQLPSPQELQTRQTAFVSSKIFDRDGNLLYEVTDPQGGRRTYVSYDEISTHVINATVATEDRDFWLHPGFDPVAIIRAIYYNVTAGEIVSGASTIPQQVARNVLLTSEERMQQTLWRKIKEAVLATELTRTYPREKIIEVYLNENNYGNRAYGIQAAAETYFGEDAADLSLAQASFLVGLPQAPAMYDIFAGGRDLAFRRHEDVLGLMVEAGYISQAEAEAAAEEIRDYPFEPPQMDLDTAPHFVVYARQTLEATYGAEALYRGEGLRVYTTLDANLQSMAETAVREGVAALAERNATNGALVAIDPATGHILAMVGSADFNDAAIDGQVNVATRCRQPGSSIKPLTYLAAFERGWTPASLLWDVRTEFPDGANPPYVPTNYDETFHGPMLVRTALANSYNVPAVETLQFVGVDGLLEMASRLGVVSLAHPEEHCPDYPYAQAPPYGLALTLGGGEVKLLEMAGAFATFANYGQKMTPTPILRIENSRGDVLVDNSAPSGDQVVSQQHAYLITDILSDTEARCRAFACPSILELSRPVAAKTGTTNDYRDAWTVGYTPDLVAGVWVGNSDNSEMKNLPGAAGAGPIWHTFMEQAHADLPVRGFVRPPGITEHDICAHSGAEANEHCPTRKSEIFAEDQPPREADEGWYQMVEIDRATSLLANEFCQDQIERKLMVVIKDERGREWAQAHPDTFNGLPLAPLEACTDATDRPQVLITDPTPGSSVEGVITVKGTVRMPDFERYDVQYGLGENPGGWGWISGPHKAQVEEGWLAEWDTTHLAPGPYTLRITAFGQGGQIAHAQVTVQVSQPTPTTEPTSFPTPTETPFPTATATQTPLPSATPMPATTTPTQTPAPTPTATATEPPPTATPTSTPEPSPTPTQTPESTPAPTSETETGSSPTETP